jgi:autotransporter strand-loop-strand O-heptosyltransferase
MFKYNLNLVNGLFFELVHTPKNIEYRVDFLEKGKAEPLYSVMLKKGMWAKHPQKYLSNYFIEIWDVSDSSKHFVAERISFIEHMKGKRVFISFESSSLGDSIAWIPYCLEFKNIYQCDVIVSTFKNKLFESVYPELTFVDRGMVVDNIVAMFEIGWFYDAIKEPVHPATIPLQKAASNILNLKHREIKPRIAFTPKDRPAVNEYVCISTKSTAQCKHWYYWSELIEALKSKGYRVFEMSQEADELGAEKLDDTSLQNVMNYLHHADHYIGLSSGISWLNWAVGKETVMISNFTEEDHEFSCIRITNKNVCNGCWNNPLFKFNKGDWNWCPENENSPRQFECHKAISMNDVLEKLLI